MASQFIPSNYTVSVDIDDSDIYKIGAAVVVSLFMYHILNYAFKL